ncbi:MAG: hypothetical protein A4E57_02072 [Syntrophorhabdaceae bacterium PtaU1.Bin034]|nr:MAG: hypothetical protein A4E57_02072 [Syntrophorhabdaceae bacterium PtaU1.Bin034]
MVTRFLVEETKEGPGNIREVIVQMKGYRPFTVPKKYFEGTDKEVGQFTPSFIQKRVAQRIMNLAGTNIPAWEAEATDSKGKRTRALVSENILPLGVIMAETAEVGMYLSEWGQGAGTKITGTPVNFYLWIMMQVGEGMTK